MRSMPHLAGAATAVGLIASPGTDPVERTRTFPIAWCSNRAAAIWERPELWTQTKRARGAMFPFEIQDDAISTGGAPVSSASFCTLRRLCPTGSVDSGIRVWMPGAGLASLAVAEDREVVEVGVESVGIAEVVEHRCDFGEGHQSCLLADFTDEVLVVLVEGEVPPSGLIAEVDVVDNADTGELVECPVDGGGIDLSC